MRALALAAVFAAAAAAVLAPVAAGAGVPTRSEFIRHGDALCRQTQRELAPLRRRAEAAKLLPEAQMWRAVTTLWTAQVRIQTRFNRRFRAIGVPAGDRTARSLVAGLDRGLALARRVRDAFAARNTGALADVLPAYLRYTLRLNARVVAYGFKSCGRS